MKLLKIIILILVVVEIIFIGIYLGSKKKPAPVPTITKSAVTIAYSPTPSLTATYSPSPSSSVSSAPAATSLPTPTPTFSQATLTPVSPHPALSPDESEDPQKLGSFAKGLKQFNKMDYDKAIVSFKEVTEKNPKNIWAHYYLFLSYVQIEENAWSKSSKAYKETTVIMSMKPDEEIRKSIDNYLEDVKHRAQGATPPPPSPTTSAAVPSPALSRLASSPPGISIPTIPTVSSKDADIHYDRGRDYDRKGNYNFAVAEYSNAIKFNPKHIEAYISRGSLYETKSELGNAAADYSRAIELRPGDAKNYYRRGKLYKSMNDNEKAKADLLKVKELDPAMADKVDLMLKEMETPKE